MFADRRRDVALAVVSGLTWQIGAILAPLFAASAIDAMLAGDRNAVYTVGRARRR